MRLIDAPEALLVVYSDAHANEFSAAFRRTATVAELRAALLDVPASQRDEAASEIALHAVALLPTDDVARSGFATRLLEAFR